MTPRKIVLATLGSLGDLYPFLALGCALQQRGHEVVLATSAEYRSHIESAGLSWHHMRPDLPEDPALYAQVMHRRRGSEFVLRHLVSFIAESYADLRLACLDADLLVSSQVALAAPLVAEQCRMRWASVVLQPAGLFSVYDAPVIPQARWLSARLHAFGPLAGKPLLALARLSLDQLGAPLGMMRQALGLAAAPGTFFLEGQQARALVLALFPACLAAPQRDWPAQVRVCGTAFWDQAPSAAGAQTRLAEFLATGRRPLVFTLGSAAVHAAGSFYAESLAACLRLSQRAVLLVGSDPRNWAQLPERLPEDILALPYAAHGALFAHAQAVIHQGGIGTLSQALRSGQPMLVVPFSHDQPDNAARAQRLGVARVLDPERYHGRAIDRALVQLLSDQDLARRARVVASRVADEDGAHTAADALEALLSAPSQHKQQHEQQHEPLSMAAGARAEGAAATKLD